MRPGEPELLELRRDCKTGGAGEDVTESGKCCVFGCGAES